MLLRAAGGASGNADTRGRVNRGAASASAGGSDGGQGVRPDRPSEAGPVHTATTPEGREGGSLGRGSLGPHQWEGLVLRERQRRVSRPVQRRRIEGDRARVRNGRRAAAHPSLPE